MLRRQRTDLIVPIRDRRQRKRYLTKRTFGYALLVSTLGFAVISLANEIRGRNTNDYGRLFRRELVQTPVEPKKIEVVQEAEPIDDAISADPMLVEPAARQQQWLNAEVAAPVPAFTAPVEHAPVPGKGRVAIVGGAEGVTIVQEQRTRPVLKGGFMRE